MVTTTGQTFVANSSLIETRFLVTGEVFECDNGSRYQVTGDPFVLLGSTQREVLVTDRWGRSHNELLTVRPGEKVCVIGRYC